MGHLVQGSNKKVVCDPLNKECLIHQCNNCPGTDALVDFLDEKIGGFDADEHLHYSQCETTNWASVLTVETTFEDYQEALIAARNSMAKHSFLAKCQANFLKSKKELLLPNEDFVLGDFAENYQFFIQDEI